MTTEGNKRKKKKKRKDQETGNNLSYDKVKQGRKSASVFLVATLWVAYGLVPTVRELGVEHCVGEPVFESRSKSKN